MYDFESLEDHEIYQANLNYLRQKDCPKAKELLTKLESMKTLTEYGNFKEDLLLESFIESYQRINKLT